MSEPATKQRPSIDFDEFERAVRLSAPPARPQSDDPLAELARLVGSHPDPYDEVFSQGAAQDHGQAQDHGIQDGARARRSPVDFAAIEAGLRGTLPAHDQHYAPQQPAYGQGGQAYYQPQDAASQQQSEQWYDPAQRAAPAARQTPGRSRSPVYAMAAVIVAGVVGIGVAFAYKGSGSGPREIAMIKAAPGPTKIQPPADTSSDQPTRDASILDKAQQPAPTKLVSRQEQPVDLAQTVQQSTPRDVGNGITPIYNFGTYASGGAANVPVPPSPGQAQQQSERADAGGVAGDIEPIRVKTRSYRPDGTPILNDQPPVAAMPAAAPVAPKTDKGAVAKASTPKSTTPKSTTRIATAPKPIVTADRGDDAPMDIAGAAAASAPAAVPHKVKPVKPAKTAAPAEATDDSAPTETAASGGGGGFAVQLAAPGSESEAKSVSSRLSQRFASELSGHRLGFHKAESNGKSVYRVRVGSLSREEATGMCEKLKSSGGSCFVAKN